MRHPVDLLLADMRSSSHVRPPTEATRPQPSVGAVDGRGGRRLYCRDIDAFVIWAACLRVTPLDSGWSGFGGATSLQIALH